MTYFLKDLSLINRDLSKTIIVDDKAQNFHKQSANGIFIKQWTHDENDNALYELAPLLKEIAMRKVPDVREALRIFRKQMMEQISRGIRNPTLSLEM